ncbi:hypothetical protein [Streptomyces sp. AM8-1-1]|nr:hypothetical protein [Streptomyces sp. AM8-1-1]WNO76816.1 hypothetical protein RPQ07_36600 [Streptomyces sp. AM8-1-1]
MPSSTSASACPAPGPTVDRYGVTITPDGASTLWVDTPTTPATTT